MVSGFLYLADIRRRGVQRARWFDQITIKTSMFLAVAQHFVAHKVIEQNLGYLLQYQWIKCSTAEI